MRAEQRALAVVVVGVFAGAGCISVTAISIGQKTSLEQQLMGSFEPLTEEEALATSVRADAGLAPYSEGEKKMLALRARQRQLFNQDDLLELKTAGCLAESRNGDVLVRSCSAPTPTLEARARAIVAEENEDRRRIVDWVWFLHREDPGVSRDQIAALYRRLIADKARAGDWLQDDQGRWQQKP